MGPFRGRGPTDQGGSVPLAYSINPMWSPIPGLIPEARAESSRQSRPLGPILAIGPPTPPSPGLAPLWVAPQEQSGLHSIAGPRPPWLRTEAWPRPLTRIEQTTDQQQMQPWRRQKRLSGQTSGESRGGLSSGEAWVFSRVGCQRRFPTALAT